MTDRPILFWAPMVRALLAGTKTQTRRVLGQFDVFRLDDGSEAPVSCIHVEGEALPRVTIGKVVTLNKLKAAVGDRLWVRESLKRNPHLWVYSADGAEVGWPARQALAEKLLDYAPSIHMPKAASRLTLTVTDVRVQRLQDISEEDAIAEGVEPIVDHGVGNQNLHRIAFDQLWDRIHGDGATYAHPWVVAYSFTVERRNIDVEG